MMSGKLNVPIKRIELKNVATFTDATISDITLVNYFYGNNGSGKTTISRAIKADNGCVVWGDDFPSGEFTRHVYNQDFVRDNFSSYGKVDGVFAMGKKGVEDKKELELKIAEKGTFETAIARRNIQIAKKKQAITDLVTSYFRTCFNKTDDIRKKFKTTQTGFIQDKQKFVTEALKNESALLSEKELSDLLLSYIAANDETVKPHTKKITRLGGPNRTKGYKAIEILATPIIGSSSTQYGEFLKSVNATDWVFERYQEHKETKGQCPYCSRDLPADFAEQIKRCFDDSFQTALTTLAECHRAYAADMADFIATLDDNLIDHFPDLKAEDVREYKDKRELLSDMVDRNNAKFEEKRKNPSLSHELESIKPLHSRLNELIDSFNIQIDAYNVIVEQKGNVWRKGGENYKKIWCHIAAIVRPLESEHKKQLTALEKEQAEIEKQNTPDTAALKIITDRITELNKVDLNTRVAMDAINRLLIENSFTGFYLRPKSNEPNAYEVVRKGVHGEIPAEYLSEGEHNFIAFLYFYHLVCSDHDGEKEISKKIVVVDDPVSSLDSNALFIVGSLVRNLVKICNRNANDKADDEEDHSVKQIFIMSHNVYFHNSLTRNEASNARYPMVSFYTVRKSGDNSSVAYSHRAGDNFMKPQNINPVKNSYAMLWGEYKNHTSAISMLSAIKRILEHYFIQLCGHNVGSIRGQFLEPKKNDFMTTNEDGTPNDSQFRLASAMIEHMEAVNFGTLDDLHAGAGANEELYRSVFEKIFTVLGHKPHFDMMMESVN